MKYLILVLALVFVMPTYAKSLKREIKELVGKHIDVAVVSFGAPNRTFKLKTGGTVYTWSHLNVSTTCIKSLITNKDNIIKTWVYEGC